MKKFLKNITLILLLVISFSFVFAGCKKENETNDIPNATDRVYGNGGLAVTKGDYLYFLNGYKSYLDVTSADKNKNVVRGAIYKTKLTASGALDMNIVLDKNGDVESSSVKKVEKVVDRIVCFENGGLYIIGNYLYYTTPNTQDNSTGEILNNYVDYCRVSLDNPGKEEVLYTSEGEVTDGDWAVYEMDGGVYLVINTGSKIVCIKNNEKKNAITMADNITSSKLWTNEDNHALNDNEKYIFYTRDVKESDSVSSGNILAKVKIGTSNEEIVRADNSTSYTIFDVKNNNIYYTKSSNSNYLWVAKASNFTGETKLTYKSYDNKYIVENDDVNSTLNRVIVYTASSSDATDGVLAYFDNGSIEANIVLNNVNITILAVEGNYVYYYDSSTIYRVDILSKETTKLINGDNQFNFSATQDMCFDVDGNYMYFLNGYTSGESTLYYLERVDLGNPNTHTFVGEFADGEEPTESDEDSTNESEDKE